jgi:hypothetical protein
LLLKSILPHFVCISCVFSHLFWCCYPNSSQWRNELLFINKTNQAGSHILFHPWLLIYSLIFLKFNLCFYFDFSMLIDSVMFSHAALDLTTHVKQKENTPQCPWWRSQSNLSNYIGNISRAFKRHHPPNCRFFFLRSNKVKEIVRNQPSLKQSAEWINKVTYLDIEDVSSFQVQCPALNW